MNKRFAVVDIETTGGLTKRDKIIEIAIVLVENGEIIQKFESLVNPGRTVPPMITSITGIDTAMVEDAPFFHEIAKEIVLLTEGAVFVAHNVRFDYGFIKRAYYELGYTYSRRQLCTHTLSRKFYPEMPSHSLGSLIRHFGIPVKRRHRALDDAEATAHILSHVLSQKNSFKTIHQLINYGVKESQLPAGITIDKLQELPEECGVYYFHNQFGEIIYVGKSINIRKRVMEHFAIDGSKSRKLHQAVCDFSYEVTGSELIALLYESMEIKKYNPEINRSLKKRTYQYAVVLDTSTPYHQLVIKRLPVEEGANVIRIFPRLRYARLLIKKLVTEFLLCQGQTSLELSEGPCYYYGLQSCLGACVNEEDHASYNDRLTEALGGYWALEKKDFILLEEGRTNDERAAVLVQEGELLGYGYIPVDSGLSLTEITDHIRTIKERQDSMAIIGGYMMQKKKFEVIDL